MVVCSRMVRHFLLCAYAPRVQRRIYWDGSRGRPSTPVRAAHGRKRLPSVSPFPSQCRAIVQRSLPSGEQHRYESSTSGKPQWRYRATAVAQCWHNGDVGLYRVAQGRSDKQNPSWWERGSSNRRWARGRSVPVLMQPTAVHSPRVEYRIRVLPGRGVPLETCISASCGFRRSKCATASHRSCCQSTAQTVSPTRSLGSGDPLGDTTAHSYTYPPKPYSGRRARHRGRMMRSSFPP